MFAKESVGIHIDAAAVRVVSVRLQARPLLLATSQRSLPEGALDTSGHLHDQAAVATALREALQAAVPRPIKIRQAYLSITESQVFRKIMPVLATVRDDDVLPLITVEATEYLPAPVETMTLDYQWIPQTLALPPVTVPEKGKEKPAAPDKAAPPPEKLISIVATEKKLVEEYLTLCGQLHLQVQAIDSRIDALARAIIRPQDTALTVVVKVTPDHATVALVKQGVVLVTGTANLTNEEGDARTVDLIADEIDHALKFYGSRTGSTEQASELLIADDRPKEHSLAKALIKATDIPSKEAAAVVAVPPNSGSTFFTALGSALYPLYRML